MLFAIVLLVIVGQPLYGDPFGLSAEPELPAEPIPNIESWGELAIEEEIEVEQDEFEEDDMEQEEDLARTESVASFASWIVTPEIDLRKPLPDKQLYQVRCWEY